jgi:2-C-methyl-D-erythritol 4-phosphate cytidylyltransferase / 2-C-methyl-D-erythritol 2,4-cyclodiphosphate synthase
MEQTHPQAYAIIVAGGNGTRARGDSGRPAIPKQLQILGGKPVVLWSAEAFSNDGRFAKIVIVCADQIREDIAAMVEGFPVQLVRGGATRTASVRAGLACLDPNDGDVVFIHDAARPGLNRETLDRLFHALEAGSDGAAPAQSVADALWHVSDGAFLAAQDRNGLLRVQTPQAFRAVKLLAAYALLAPDDERADDVAVARDAGLNIVSVAGSLRLDKITWPQDFDRMETLLSTPLLPRLGSGFDAHRFVDGDNVTLCGIVIPHTARLAGHSDADVGWHALADAIYGALSAGDIGHHFPPTDLRWKGAASAVFLRHAGDMVRASGGKINHVDVTIICEAPKVGPHREAMRAATAQVLDLRVDQVSIKATTTEAMGFTGRREGIAAQASATVLLPETFRIASEVPR